MQRGSWLKEFCQTIHLSETCFLTEWDNLTSCERFDSLQNNDD